MKVKAKAKKEEMEMMKKNASTTPIPANICLRRYCSGWAKTRILTCRSASSAADVANGSSRATAAAAVAGDPDGEDPSVGSEDANRKAASDGAIVGGSDAAMRDTSGAANGLVMSGSEEEEEDVLPVSRETPPRPEAANGLGVSGGCEGCGG